MKSQNDKSFNLTSSSGVLNLMQLINLPTESSWCSETMKFHISISLIETELIKKIDIAFYYFGKIQYRLFGTHFGTRKVDSYTEQTIKTYSSGNDKCIQFSTYKREPTILCQIDNDEIFIDSNTEIDDLFQYSTINDNFVLRSTKEDIKELIDYSLSTDKKYQDYTIIQYNDEFFDDMIRMFNDSIRT